MKYRNEADERGYELHPVLDYLTLDSELATPYLSKTVPGGVAIYKDDASALADRLTPMKLGRWLTKYVGLEPLEVNRLVEKCTAGVSELKLHVRTEPEDICQAYIDLKDTGSCMDGRRFNDIDGHPCSVYGGDCPYCLHMYTVQDGDTILARAMFPRNTRVPIRWYIPQDSKTFVLEFINSLNLGENRDQRGYTMTVMDDIGPYLDTECKTAGIVDGRYYVTYDGEYRFDSTDGEREHNGYACDGCDCRISDDESRFADDGNTYCDDCYNERYSWCEKCGVDHQCDDMRTVTNSRGREQAWCDYCADHHAAYCEDCNEYHETYITDADDDTYCESCYGDRYGVCDDCADETNRDEYVKYNGRCKSCHDTPVECPSCLTDVHRDDIGDIAGFVGCHTCRMKALGVAA